MVLSKLTLPVSEVYMSCFQPDDWFEGENQKTETAYSRFPYVSDSNAVNDCRLSLGTRSSAFLSGSAEGETVELMISEIAVTSVEGYITIVTHE